LDKLIELDPKNETAYLNKGLALTNLEKNEEAIQCLNEAIKLDPNDELAYDKKGEALINL